MDDPAKLILTIRALLDGFTYSRPNKVPALRNERQQMPTVNLIKECQRNPVQNGWAKPETKSHKLARKRVFFLPILSDRKPKPNVPTREPKKWIDWVAGPFQASSQTQSFCITDSKIWLIAHISL